MRSSSTRGRRPPPCASSSGTPCAAAGARITVPAFPAVSSSRTTTRTAPARPATRRAGDFRALNRRLHGLLLEAEARTLDEVHQALDAGAERVLLDNMTTAAILKAVEDVHL